MNRNVRAYLAEIGRRGGRKSRRSLEPETAREMTLRGPRARVVEIAGCGHAPALMATDQIATIAAFLDEGD